MGVNTPLTIDSGSTHEKEHRQDNSVIRSDEMTKKNDPEVQLKETPNLIEESEGEIQHRKESEEDDYMDYNIQQINIAGDLSLRHMNSLKAKRERPTIPLQVKTRSSKDKYSNSDK
ncbi:hypothetical protein KY289_024206 [Solanum tuberosum]|nr:hypothetical protein KY289_024206 [Solanum tuberosum]